MFFFIYLHLGSVLGSVETAQDEANTAEWHAQLGNFARKAPRTVKSDGRQSQTATRHETLEIGFGDPARCVGMLHCTPLWASFLSPNHHHNRQMKLSNGEQP